MSQNGSVAAERRRGATTDGRVPMPIYCTYFGIDSHLRTTTICALTPEDGELRTRTFRGNDYGEMAEWMAGFPQPSHGVYESGCTGFVPARMLTRGDTLVEPVASSKLPSSADSRSRKNDRRDAERLARLALAGEVSPVWVPPEQAGGLRELAQATGDLACVREAARQRVNAILCRHGMSWDERTPTGRPEKRRCQHLRDWLRSVGLGDAGSQAAYLAALSAAESAEVAYDGPRARAEGIAKASDPGPPVDALMCVKGVGFSSALAFAAEVGDFSRFASGRRAASYFGLAPSGGPGAEGRGLGRVPGNGCALVRRPLIEGAWVLARGNPACRKRGGTPVPLAIREHARACSGRLLGRRRGLIARGPVPREANTATAAEMARMLPHIGRDAQEAAVLATEVARAA